jgi:hypothetical protein
MLFQYLLPINFWNIAVQLFNVNHKMHSAKIIEITSGVPEVARPAVFQRLLAL